MCRNILSSSLGYQRNALPQDDSYNKYNILTTFILKLFHILLLHRLQICTYLKMATLLVPLHLSPSTSLFSLTHNKERAHK